MRGKFPNKDIIWRVFETLRTVHNSKERKLEMYFFGVWLEWRQRIVARAGRGVEDDVKDHLGDEEGQSANGGGEIAGSATSVRS